MRCGNWVWVIMLEVEDVVLVFNYVYVRSQAQALSRLAGGSNDANYPELYLIH
jgi:hypothetical protein